jgi:hypothetical protein
LCGIFAGGEGNELIAIFGGHARIIQGKLLTLPDIGVKLVLIPRIHKVIHVGIVKKCEDGVVYTVEGNSGDACRQNSYPVGYYEILGYGTPNY